MSLHFIRVVSNALSNTALRLSTNTNVAKMAKSLPVSGTIFEDEVLKHLHEEWLSGQEENSVIDSSDGFTEILEWLATPPQFTTLRINTCNGQPGEILGHVGEVLSKQYADRGQAAPECSFHPQISDLIVIPNKGPTEFEQRDKEVIVGLGCGIAVLRGADVYAQGIMAAPSHLSVDDSVSIYADVEGEVRKGLMKKFTGKRVFVGNGRAVMDRAQIFGSGGKSSGLAIKMTEPLYLAPSLSGLMPSLIFPQNLPSAVCAHVLDPQPGETILDMCAAPGGKTTHIGTLMKNKGRLVAFDKSKGKIKNIENNAASWNLDCIESYHFDGTQALQESAVLEGSPPFPPESFDRIMLDAPCSALGQRPSFRNKMKISEVTSYAPLQKKLFSSAWGLLRNGGTLVFSTCTWTMEENEKLVVWALKTFSGIKLMPQVGIEYECSKLSFTLKMGNIVLRIGVKAGLTRLHAHGRQNEIFHVDHVRLN